MYIYVLPRYLSIYCESRICLGIGACFKFIHFQKDVDFTHFELITVNANFVPLSTGVLKVQTMLRLHT